MIAADIDYIAVARLDWRPEQRWERSSAKDYERTPARIKYHLGLSRRWQKRRNDESKLSADFHYRKYDDVEDALIMDPTNSIRSLSKRLGRTTHAVQTRRKYLTRLHATPNPPAR